MKGYRDFSSSFFCIATYCFMFSYLSEKQILLFLVGVLVHEAGHILCMLLLGVPLRGVHITFGGIIIRGAFDTVPFFSEVLVHYSGAATNLLAFIFLCHFQCHEAALVHAAIAVFNLLPLPEHDGYRALFALAHCMKNTSSLLYGLWLVSMGVRMLLAVFSAWLFWFGAMHDPLGTTMIYGSLFFSVVLNIGCYARQEGKFGNET